MELTNDFEVAVPVEEAWSVLTDIERIAPCMPGAELQEVEGEEYRGIVKVKVGPITAQYKGKATFQEKDDAQHVAVLKADGRDTRGQGNANALITARLESAGEGTKVSVHTDLTVTGKVAQFGRGVMADVSAKLFDQFVENLETTVLAGDTGSSGTGSSGTGSSGAGDEHVVEAAEEETTSASVGTPSEDGVRRIDQARAEPVDLMSTAGAPVAKRVVPAVAALVILLILWRWLNDR
ncbi:MAG: SRPBCC family protein [Acidimicrobiales bacterium]|nr:SRPBCC family protein [Acidimicrobiales bacterium]